MNLKPVKKAKKGLLNAVFSRASLIFVLLLIQIGIFAITVTRLNAYANYIHIVFFLLEVTSVIYIINSTSNPAFKITWILLIFVLPFFGTAFYVFMKIMPGTALIEKRLFDLNRETKEYMTQEKETLTALRLSKPANANLAHYMANQVDFPIHKNTSVRYFPSGEEKFEEMKRELEKAERFIFMEYFIIEEGKMWNTLLEILKKKVQEGV